MSVNTCLPILMFYLLFYHQWVWLIGFSLLFVANLVFCRTSQLLVHAVLSLATCLALVSYWLS